MRLSELLGVDLKSDPVLDLVEQQGLQVIYQLDTLRENLSDSYSISAPVLGFELRFDAAQSLDTIWCHLRDNGHYRAIDPEILGVPLFDTMEAVLVHGAGLGAEVEARENVEFLGKSINWAKICQKHAIHHYEFDAEGPKMVTIMSSKGTA